MWFLLCYYFQQKLWFHVLQVCITLSTQCISQWETTFHCHLEFNWNLFHLERVFKENFKFPLKKVKVNFNFFSVLQVVQLDCFIQSIGFTRVVKQQLQKMSSTAAISLRGSIDFLWADYLCLDKTARLMGLPVFASTWNHTWNSCLYYTA